MKIQTYEESLGRILKKLHCPKSVCNWDFSGQNFPAFRLNSEVKIRAREAPNTDTSHAVIVKIL